MDNKIDKIDVGRLTNWPIDSHTVAAVPAPVPQVIVIIIIIILFFFLPLPDRRTSFALLLGLRATLKSTGFIFICYDIDRLDCLNHVS